MNKRAAILLILYAIMMLSYGALEMTHDLLHYLAANHHSHLHAHQHGHHHHFHDHQQIVVSDSHDSEEQRDLPSLIHFFLYTERKPSFSFKIELTGKMKYQSDVFLTSIHQHPATPPPEINLL